jgi:hypothetical protein
VIVRILEDGRWDVPDELRERLSELDDHLIEALEAGDEAGYKARLTEVLELVRTKGSEVPAEEIGPSDLFVPNAEMTMAEVAEILQESH